MVRQQRGRDDPQRLPPVVLSSGSAVGGAEPCGGCSGCGGGRKLAPCSARSVQHRACPLRRVWHLPCARRVPLRQLSNYKGGRQQRCVICGQHCSWACAFCSAGGDVSALHPALSGCGKNIKRFSCLAAHRANPLQVNSSGSSSGPGSGPGSGRGKKRARMPPTSG